MHRHYYHYGIKITHLQSGIPKECADLHALLKKILLPRGDKHLCLYRPHLHVYVCMMYVRTYMQWHMYVYIMGGGGGGGGRGEQNPH